MRTRSVGTIQGQRLALTRNPERKTNMQTTNNPGASESERQFAAPHGSAYWVPEHTAKPPVLERVVVWGKLNSADTEESWHEGFWCGAFWNAVTWRNVTFASVTHWMRGPEPPNNVYTHKTTK